MSINLASKEHALLDMFIPRLGGNIPVDPATAALEINSRIDLAAAALEVKPQIDLAATVLRTPILQHPTHLMVLLLSSVITV